MMFCPKCKSIMVPQQKANQAILKCSCGYKSSKKENMILREEVKLSKKDEIEVVEKKPEILPRIREDCPKCRNQSAYYWTVQTRASDEAATRFFKCTKCNHTWREYS